MIPWIDTSDPDWSFPPVEQALSDPDGLLCAGADLKPSTLLRAYRHGLFPWYSEGQPILWWSPDPRAVFLPDQIYCSKRLARTIRSERFQCRLDTDFDQIVEACAQTPRAGQDGTWITADMLRAYQRMHDLSHAHCISVYQQGNLVGGLYGLAIGRVFFGESMFSWARDASKVALVTLGRFLTAQGFVLIDAQVESDHIMSLGAQLLPRSEFVEQLRLHCPKLALQGNWSKLL